MAPTPFPLPPIELAARVGGSHADGYAGYEEIGQRMRADIYDILPSGWSFEGKRVLDFGCGAGRTLRHFSSEAATATIFGCDIDGPSVQWMEAAMSPPFSIFTVEESPALGVPEHSLDLIWAISVFTHLTDTWSGWLLALHDALAENGLLIATFIGPGAAAWVTDEPWDEDKVGMTVLHYGQPWDLGGPMVMHSGWWLREHWGRAFEIVELRDQGFATDGPGGQGILLLRKRPRSVTCEELERVDASNPREIGSLQYQIRQQYAEARVARLKIAALERERDQARALLVGRGSALRRLVGRR